VRCGRCHGLLAWEPCAECDPDALAWRRSGWKCINCGDYLDCAVALNRARLDDLRAPQP